MKLERALILVAIAAACVNAGQVHAQTPAKKSGEAIRKESAPAVIHITIKSRANLAGADQDVQTGSGFIIGKGGFALTSNHLFPDPDTARIDSIEVVTEAAPLTPQLADIVRREPQDDLALIKLRGNRPWPALCLSDSNAVAVEAGLYALGYVNAREPILTSTVGRLTNIAGNRWQTDLGLNPGNSGAPVFSDSGQVIGIVAGGNPEQQRMNYVVPSQYALPLMKLGGGRECPPPRPRTRPESARDDRPSAPPPPAMVDEEDLGPITVAPGGRKRVSIATGSSAEFTEDSIVVAVRDPDLQRNSTGIKAAGRSTRMGIGQEVDLSLYGKNKCRLAVLRVRAEAVDFLMKCM